MRERCYLAGMLLGIVILIGCAGGTGVGTTASSSGNGGPGGFGGGGTNLGTLSANSTSLDLGSLEIGSTRSATLSVTNTGSGTASVSKVAISGTGFTLSNPPAVPFSIDAGKNSTLTIAFTPTVSGAVNGSLTVTSDASNTSLTIALLGNGLAPGDLGVSSPSLDFASVTVGSSSTLNASLSAGATSVTVTSGSATGQGFSLGGITFPVTVPAGQSVPYTVTFAPLAAGSATGSISFLSSAVDSPTTQALSGTGTGGSTNTGLAIGIEIQPSAATLATGITLPFTATVVYSDGSTQDVSSTATWSSSVTSVASVDHQQVTGAAAGTTVISAVSGGVTGFTIVSVGPPPSGNSVSFYVAPPPLGNDSNAGTQAAPFATLDHARQAVKGTAGSVVQFAAGTYYNSTTTFKANDSGAAGNPIIYQAAPGARVVLSGGLPVTGWTHSGTTWAANLTGVQNFEGLYYQSAGTSDMERRSRPRTTTAPASDQCTSYPCSGFLYIGSGTPAGSYTSFQYNGTDVASTYHDIGLGDVEVLPFEKWSVSRLRLLSASGGTATVTSSTSQSSGYGFLAGHRYLIENCSPVAGDCAAIPGQWYLDRCPNIQSCTTPSSTWTLTYYAQSGETPSSDTIVIPQQTHILVGMAASNIVFEGLTFSNDNWFPGSPSVIGVTCTGACGLGDAAGSPNVSAAVSFTDAQNVVFNGCTFSHTQGWGVELEGASSNNAVINSSFYDIGTGGVRIGTYSFPGDSDANTPQYNLVENNLITASGRVQPTGIGTGIWIGNAHHNVVAHNDIHDLYNGAIGVGFTYGSTPIVGHDNIASFNLMYDLGQGVTSDMGGIHFAAAGVPGNMMLNNVVHDVTFNFLDSDGYGAQGLYIDQASVGVVAHNNLAYNLGTGGIFNNLTNDTSISVTAQNNVILNNIFAFTGKDIVQRGGNISNSFAFVQNIAYYDMGKIQGGGFWQCASTTTCTGDFVFNRNDYFSTNGSAPGFEMSNGTSSLLQLTLQQWQALGEDTASVTNVDPNFPGTTTPAGFTVPSSSPVVSQINFVPFDPTLAGLLPSDPQTTFTTPPQVPASISCTYQGTTQTYQAAACPAFPLQLQSSY